MQDREGEDPLVGIARPADHQTLGPKPSSSDPLENPHTGEAFVVAHANARKAVRIGGVRDFGTRAEIYRAPDCGSTGEYDQSRSTVQVSL